MKKLRIGILTGGGDVQPLNAVIAAAQTAAIAHNIELIGFRHGWKGILESSYIALSRNRAYAEIGGTILRSSRVNIATIEDGTNKIKINLERLGIEGLIVIGGEDTLSNSFLLLDYPQVLISKTIDNDVGIVKRKKELFSLSDIVNHFTLGHPSAARKIASFVSLQEGMRTTAYSHERIIIVESMGMHAGWLALSSCMGNPDFIIIPEFPLNYDTFLQKVADRYKRNRNVIIVVAEGARWKDGSYLSADETEKDSFGHPRFKGAAAILSAKLKNDLKGKFDTRNVNAVNPSYLYRSGKPCDIDFKYGSLLGKQAVEYLIHGTRLPALLTLKLSRGKFVCNPIKLDSDTTIAKFHRFVDERLYDSDKLCATEWGRKYWKTIVPEFSKITYGI